MSTAERKRRAGAGPRDVAAGVARPLAEAKLAAPHPGGRAVERPRILRSLDAAMDAALTLVAAPAGAGKSTAVGAWCASREAARCWVTLDAHDNDPTVLWTYVATAIDRALPGRGPGVVGRPGATASPADPVELLNGLRDLDHPLVLVLDNLHRVTDRGCLASIDDALERLPANVHVVALTRFDPALSLARLRAAGDLVELRADDLAFTVGEARELVVGIGGVDLGVDEIAMLHERTMGWAAALVLAAIWLRAVDDPRAAVREFGGDHRFVAEYLSHEVIASLTDDVRAFLLRASVLGRFTAALCDGVLDRSDSASVLTELERSNQFVVPLEHGGWYRVHPLFAEFARFELAAREPGGEAELHRRAAEWFGSRRLPAEAVEHAAAACDHELVARLLVADHLLLLARNGGARTLLGAVQALPVELVAEHPELAASAAAAATMLGRGVERRRLLRLADRIQAERPERCGPSVRAVAGTVRAASVDTDVGEAVRQGRRAVEIARAGAEEAVVAALGGYARALYLAGEIDDAWDAAVRAVEHPEAARRAPGHALARVTLALVALERGQPAIARLHAAEARLLAGATGSSRSWLGANASVALGSVLAGEGRVAEAERELAQAERFFRDEIATVHHGWMLLLLARVQCRRGRLREAEASLRRGRETIRELVDGGRLPSVAAEVARELAKARRRAARGEVLAPPTAAELAVLGLLASELSVREIGQELFLSVNTVRSHTRSIYRKLGVSSRADAIARADALGFLRPAESSLASRPPGDADVARTAAV